MKKEDFEKHRKGRGVLLGLLIILAIIVVILLLILISPKPRANVALIPIDGEILSGKDDLVSQATFSDDFIKVIEDVTKNSNIKAIIFEINSPGGSAIASQEIASAIQKANEKVLTVALIREVGASGAYWIASSCDYIIASPLSITGSIGVIGSYLDYAGLLERYNVTYERLVSGQYKDIGTPYKELTTDERAILQNIMDSIYDTFISEVSKNRNLSEEKVKEMANGLFYLGTEAKNLGLVDSLGIKQDALNYIQDKEGIKPLVREYKKRYRYSLLTGQIELASYWIGKGIGSSLVEKATVNNLNVKT